MSVAIAPGADDFRWSVQPFLRAHCVRCHGAENQSGDVRLDDLPAEVGQAVERWTAVRDQLRDGLMPPRKQPRPDATQARAVVTWITAKVGIVAPKLPNPGNLVPHELLFGQNPALSEPMPGRVWRLSPAGYTGWLTEVYRSRLPALTQPFTLTAERGIRDFAGLYTIDEPATEILLHNAEIIVEAQTAHAVKDGKVVGKRDAVPEFVRLLDPAVVPTRAQLDAAVQTQFRLAIGCRATAEDIKRLVGLYEKCAASGDRLRGGQNDAPGCSAEDGRHVSQRVGGRAGVSTNARVGGVGTGDQLGPRRSPREGSDGHCFPGLSKS